MTRQIYSSICRCGHRAEQHHGQMIVDPEVARLSGEDRVAGACLAYGSNEIEGCDPWGHSHCGGYVDAKDPDSEVWKSWDGNTREDVLAKGYDAYWAAQDRIDATVTIIENYGGAATAEQKQWCLDMIMRALLGCDYAEWRLDYRRRGLTWSEGEKQWPLWEKQNE